MPGLTSETKAAYTNGTKTNGVKTTIATSKKGDAPAKSSNEILFGVLDNITAESFSNEHDRSQALLAAYNLVARLETAWDFFARLCMGQPSLGTTLQIGNDLQLYQKWEQSGREEMNVAELSELVSCEESLLVRLLRQLVANGILDEVSSGVFKRTKLTRSFIQPWFHTSGRDLANMMAEAGYLEGAQREFLGFYRDTVCTELGNKPLRTDGAVHDNAHIECAPGAMCSPASKQTVQAAPSTIRAPADRSQDDNDETDTSEDYSDINLNCAPGVMCKVKNKKPEDIQINCAPGAMCSPANITRDANDGIHPECAPGVICAPVSIIGNGSSDASPECAPGVMCAPAKSNSGINTNNTEPECAPGVICAPVSKKDKNESEQSTNGVEPQCAPGVMCAPAKASLETGIDDAEPECAPGVMCAPAKASLETGIDDAEPECAPGVMCAPAKASLETGIDDAEPECAPGVMCAPAKASLETGIDDAEPECAPGVMCAPVSKKEQNEPLGNTNGVEPQCAPGVMCAPAKASLEIGIDAVEPDCAPGVICAPAKKA